jgi:hypothetical protein
MAYETVIEVAKLVLLPGVGFLVGFAAQWFLQERKSRDELVRALADQRAASLCKLWEITTLPAEVTALEDSMVTPSEVRERLDRSVLDWYTKQAGALFLSWNSTQLLFRLLDLMRSEQATKKQLESAVSSLRSQLKLDCGVYSRSEAKRDLTRPRPSPWKIRVFDDEPRP